MLGKALPAGTYRVRVLPPPNAEKSSPLDSRYESFDKSGLTFTAAAGSAPQQVNFKLAKRGR